MASSYITGLSYNHENDRTALDVNYRIIDVTGANPTAMLAAATATLPAIGATAYGGLTLYTRTISEVRDGAAQARLIYRTQQFDDLIETAASGTIIAKGMSSYTEDVLRDRHPTSGATFLLGSAGKQSIKEIRSTEPRLEAWWEKKHTSLTTLKAAATTLTGAINSDTWNGYAAAKWLCVDVSSRQEKLDAGDIWVARYSFAYKPETWVANVRTFQWNSNTVASITAATKATAAFNIYKSLAFTSYGFTF